MMVRNRNAAQAFVTKDTSVIREILAPQNSEIVRQSLAEATLPPGSSTLAHLHPNTEEIYYILAGDGLMAIEDERRTVVPGDAIGILAGQRHQICNIGRSDLVFLCCCVPAYTDADTVFCDSLLAP
jgi:mannose-6-phosphate isomerase-like protein (cupin superfamily)